MPLFYIIKDKVEVKLNQTQCNLSQLLSWFIYFSYLLVSFVPSASPSLSSFYTDKFGMCSPTWTLPHFPTPVSSSLVRLQFTVHTPASFLLPAFCLLQDCYSSLWTLLHVACPVSDYHAWIIGLSWISPVLTLSLSALRLCSLSLPIWFVCLDLQ